MRKPKRDDLKYIAISYFKDFEFVDCIAFEMAIRNKENFQALKNVIVYKYSDFEYKHHPSAIEDSSEISESFRKIYMETYHIPTDKDMDMIIEYAKNIKLLEDNGISIEKIEEFFIFETKETCLKHFANTQHFTLEPNKNSFSWTTVDVTKYVLLRKSSDYPTYNHLDKLHMDKQDDKHSKSNDETLKKYGLTSLGTVPLNSERCQDIECFKDHERTEINFKYQRPRLQFKTNLNTLVNLNLALPLAELEYQLKILKMKLNDLNLHTDINSSINKEIAGNDYYFDTNEYLKKQNREDTYADLFFTYDYFNYVQPILERYNKIQKIRLDREIGKIQQNKALDKHDKQNKIQEEKKGYKERKLNKPCILMEIEKQIELFPELHTLEKDLYDKEISNEEYRNEKERITQSYFSNKQRASKAEKDLTYMQTMIDDLQYKEFITGIKNPTKNP